MEIDRDELLDWLLDNPNPEDEDVHAYAEEQGYEVDEVEEIMYEFATSYAKLIEGGKSGDTDTKVDPEQLKKGIKVESEHTDDPVIQEKIAMDHLSEIPTYYTGLDKMEKSMKHSKSALKRKMDKEIE